MERYRNRKNSGSWYRAKIRTDWLASTRKDRVATAQIYNRLSCVIRVPPPNADDCKSVGVEFNVEGKDAYGLPPEILVTDRYQIASPQQSAQRENFDFLNSDMSSTKYKWCLSRLP